MVDIVFLLVILAVFPISHAIQGRGLLAGTRWRADGGMEEAGMYINLSEDGEIVLSISEPPVTLEELAIKLRAYVSARALGRLRADGNTPIFNQVVKVLRVPESPPCGWRQRSG